MAFADQVPSEPLQPAPVVQVPQEALDVAGVFDQ